MSSLNNIPAYLKNRGFNGPWKISPEPNRKFDQTLVIPAYAESEYLPPTLLSLNENNADILKDTLVVVVINNAENSPEEILELAKEMNARLDGTWQFFKEDEDLQEKFWDTFPSSHPEGKCPSRIGAHFLRENKNLLE